MHGQRNVTKILIFIWAKFVINAMYVCVWKLKFLFINYVGQIVFSSITLRKKKVCATFSEAILVR